MMMQVSSFSCPHCSATLRLKERRFIGKRINCPDCGERMLIVADGKGTLKAQTAESPAPKKASRVEQDAQVRPAAAGPGHERTTDEGSATRWRNWLSQWAAMLKSPVGIAWTVAGCMVVLLCVAILGPFGDEQPNDSSTIAQAEPPVDEDLVNRGAVADAANPKALPADEVALAGPHDARIRLVNLGGRLTRHRDQHGHFPAGTVYADELPPEERFSWLAVLAAESKHNGSAAPLWDRPWRDPLNERFVRRNMPAFQNPDVKPLVGPNGYPATHFVGMAGLGDDAPRLPVDHPRAGIFGVDRRTKITDVRDGTSNTIMVAGVSRDPGAWAAGGRATVRALTQEPYVNGPDGFGTGQRDSMLVLMADGSVREVSNGTEPTIVRRMAAMADGLPLNPKVVGEPGKLADGRRHLPPDPEQEHKRAARDGKSPVKSPDKSAEKPPQAGEAGQSEPHPQKRPNPPTPVIAKKKVDVEAALKQRIRSFRQVRAIPFRQLLLQVEEMAGIPIRLDEDQLGAAATKLDQPVSLESENTTVGDLLQALLRKIGLAYEIEADGIRIHPADR